MRVPSGVNPIRKEFGNSLAAVFGGPTQDPKYVERPMTYGSSTVGRFTHREHDGDYYTQPGSLFQVMTPEQRERLIGNIAAGLSQSPRHIQDRQLQHFYEADPPMEKA